MAESKSAALPLGDSPAGGAEHRGNRRAGKDTQSCVNPAFGRSTTSPLSRRGGEGGGALQRQETPVSGLHPRLFAHAPPSARRSRHAAPFPRQPALGPPNGH